MLIILAFYVGFLCAIMGVSQLSALPAEQLGFSLSVVCGIILAIIGIVVSLLNLAFLASPKEEESGKDND